MSQVNEIICTGGSAYISLRQCVTRYMHCFNEIYALVALRISRQHFELVRYVIYIYVTRSAKRGLIAFSGAYT